MARVKLTEYRSKRLLLGELYSGIEVRSGADLPSRGRFVAKVEGIKKRFKQGLVALNVSGIEARRAITRWKRLGFSRFLVEPYVPHGASEERYLSFERVREGIRVLFAESGGVNVEEHPEAVKSFILESGNAVSHLAGATGLPHMFLSHALRVFDKHFFGFLEMNPLVVRGEDVFVLDAAILADSAGAFLTNEWGEEDIVQGSVTHKAEARVKALDATTPASLKLSVLNPDGALFFLLSAGGGSIVVADEAALLGAEGEIANYGEYSGGPTREETYLYAKEVIGLLLASRAKRKALVIAGPVANFTDVYVTFLGIIDALSESSAALRKARARVFVRRGGPNEEKGLSLMREFLERESLFGSVYGSEAPITAAAEDAARFLKV